MSDNAIARPSIGLVTLSTIVVGLCCVFLGVALGPIFGPFDFCTLTSALLVSPWPAWLGVAQYLAVSRGNIRASRHAHTLSVILGAFLLMGAIVLSAAMLTSGFDVADLAFLATLLALIAPLLPCALVTRRWEQQLLAAHSMRDHSSSGPQPRGRWQLSLRETFVFLTMCGVVLGSAVYVSRSLKPRWAEHVDASASPMRLPAGASDVTYYEALRAGYFCEFTCSEAAFRRWIETGEMRFGRLGVIQEIQAERRHQRHARSPFDGSSPVASVINGLDFTYGDVAKNGFVVRAIYDRDTHRAYYSRMND
jgi:hypothetical protein